MADTEQQDWPNRGLEILVPSYVLCALSVCLLSWTIAYSILTKRKLLICDFLLVTASTLDITAAYIRWKVVKYGQGRHIADPSISKPNDVLDYSYYLWIIQIVNLFGVAILKFSICAYLLALKFSKVYLGFVWASIMMVLVFNLLLPIIGVFCSTPFESNWNRAIEGKCLLKAGAAGLSYMQAATNIVTDLVYVVSPIIYLSTVQLSRRTKWGLRVVFCLGLVVTACSVVKATTLPMLFKTQDPTWDSTDLLVCSGIELSVGILIAALPPLRKQFDALFQRLLPSTFLNSRPIIRSAGGGIPLYEVTKASRRRTRIEGDGDDDDGDSERRILGALAGKREITKTVVHEVTNEDRHSLQAPDQTYHAYK